LTDINNSSMVILQKK